MQVSIIAAISRNGVIGKDNKLPWRLSSDLQRFRKLTDKHYLIVGRKTFESIGRPLSGRTMIVLTTQPNFARSGILVADDLEGAFELARPAAKAFVIGGAGVFRDVLPACTRMYITWVEAKITGDTYFPDWDPNAWKIIKTEKVPADANNQFPSTFNIYERI